MSAWGVGPNQISGGPGWLASDRFEIAAKADRPVDDDAVLMLMLQNLLKERFHLVVHREKRTMAALILEATRGGAKVEKAAGGEPATNTTTSNARITIEARNTGMDLFARVLARQTELPVIDRTGPAGVFNFQLHWTPVRTSQPDKKAAEEPSLFTAIQEQLGLRLRSEQAPVEVLMIDHVEHPSEN